MPLNQDLQTALLYSASTVAQTLAGAMGLLGAIVLFALQESTRSIERAATKLAELPNEAVNPLFLRHLLTRRSFHEIARYYGEVLRPGASTETSMEGLVQYSTLTWELDHDNALRRAFWAALFASGVVIALSLVLTPLAPTLSGKPRLGRMVLGVDVLGALGCLIVYGFLVRVMLRTSPHEPIPATDTYGRG